MSTAKIDISVLILFFNRPERLAEVFAQVKKACPARLFLYQDGPRSEADNAAIEECRRVVDDAEIDWQCDVMRNYQETNSGCDPSGYRAQAWAFAHTDKLIVLEDDCVPSVSFFAFCKELLDRYEHDSQVWMLAGFNALEKVHTTTSYFFTDIFSIWGWASWRRVFDTWDATYSWLNDTEKRAKIEETIRRKGLRNDFLTMAQEHQQSGREHFETIFWASMLLNDALAIMSSVNQINNIGISEDSTHFTTTLRTMPRRLRQQFIMPRHEIDFPLCHPTEKKVDTNFKEAVYLLNAWNNPWRKVQYSLEELLLNIRYGRFTAITKALTRRIKKWRTLLVYYAHL